MTPATSHPPVAETSEQEKASNWLDSFDDPSSRSGKTKRTEWDADDGRLLKEALRDFSELPTTAQIRSIIKHNRRLEDLMDREGWAHIYNKVKNLFRKKKQAQS